MTTDRFILLTEDHRMIADAVAKVFDDLSADDTTLRQTTGVPLSAEVISAALGELGLTGEDTADATMTSALVQAQIAMAAGRACLAYPILETLLAQALAPRVGVSLSATAFSSASVGLRVDADRVEGVLGRVPFATAAGSFLASARVGDHQVLVTIPFATDGVSLSCRHSVETDYPLHDVAVAISATSEGVQVIADALAVAALRRRADLLAAAELAGACARMVAMTREHLVARSQFGQVLGSYQVLKHRLAEAHVLVEASIAAVNYAAAADDAGHTDAAPSIAGAKRFAGAAGKVVSETAMQLHGAIGYTMEYPLHLVMRRAHRLANSFTAGADLDRQLFNQFRNEAVGA